MEHLFIVILAGGGGTRLWPKSREKTPKQFLSLYTDFSLMQDTYKRARLFVDDAHILVVSNKAYVEDVRKQLPTLPQQNIIAEPAKRETAPAMLLGSIVAHAQDPHAVVVNLASDHIATDEKEFVRVIRAAVHTASSSDSIVAVGITPTFAHSGLGYIKIGAKLSDIDGLPLYKVDSFTEKPDVATAQKFIDTGKYFWNACNYVWSTKTILAAFTRYAPDTLSKMHPLVDLVGTDEFEAALGTAYKDIEKIAIDYAISEKADNLVLIPGDFGWNDIGDWKVVYDLQKKNADGMVVLTSKEPVDVYTHESTNNLVHTHDRTIALVGVHDLVVIDTGEILLVMPKEKSQDVKKIVEKIKEQNPKYL